MLTKILPSPALLIIFVLLVNIREEREEERLLCRLHDMLSAASFNTQNMAADGSFNDEEESSSRQLGRAERFDSNTDSLAFLIPRWYKAFSKIYAFKSFLKWLKTFDVPSFFTMATSHPCVYKYSTYIVRKLMYKFCIVNSVLQLKLFFSI